MISDVAIANGEVSSSIPKGSVNYLYKANGSLTRLIRTDILPNSSSEFLVLDASLSYNENRELTGLTEKIKTGGGVRETEYTYAYDHDGRPVSVEYGDLSQTKSYDGYGRLTSETVSENNTQAVSRSYTYKDLSTTRTTPQVQSLASAFGNGSITHSYTYDQNGRILSDITANTSSVYEYDSLGQLVWEKSASKGKAWQYTYDLGGNILSKTEYDYANGTVGNQTSQKLYAYGDSEWHDLLTSYNGDPITYDTIGNPLSYRGWTMDWQAGRQLRSMSKNSTSLSFEYDESGLRTKKTVGTDETRYVWNGGMLAAQLGPSASFFFHYDASGEMISYTYVPASGTEKEYFLIKNLQGDVERVVTSTGSIVAQYNYDAWGNVVYSAGTFKNTNPIRYRGYYFDTESGLYYLKNRYYDPQVGRFINADSQFDENAGFAGYSLFVYAGNNPVLFKDDRGDSITVAIIIGAAVGAAIGGYIGNEIAECKGCEGWDKAVYIACGAVLGGSLCAAGTYFLSSAAVSVSNIGFIGEVSTLLGKMPELYGSTRDRLLFAVQDRSLYNIIDQLYRPGASIGDGGTAAALIKEFYSGESIHLTKATERLIQLNKLISSGNLSLNDLDIAQALRDDLQYAVNLFKAR